MFDFIYAFSRFVIYVFLAGFISNTIGYLVPRNRINTDAFPYKSFKWEKEGMFYQSFKVKQWKTKVPDMSKILKTLYPKTLSYNPTPKRVQRLVQESCVAEFVHVMLIASAPLIDYYIDGPYGEFFTVLYMLGNIPYIVIQRYNRPSLKRLYVHLVKRESEKLNLGGIKREGIDIIL